MVSTTFQQVSYPGPMPPAGRSMPARNAETSEIATVNDPPPPKVVKTPQAEATNAKESSPFALPEQYFKAPPPKSAFIAEGVKHYFLPSLLNGGDKYFRHIQRSPVKSTAFIGGALGMGLLLSMANHSRKYIHLGFLSVLLVYPVLQAVRNLPRFHRAYEQLQEGNPRRADQTLKLAIDNTTYSLFHALVKPYTAAGVVAAFLSIPRIINHAPHGGLENIFRGVLNLIRLKSPFSQQPAEKLFTVPVLKQFKALNDKLLELGNRAETYLSKRFQWARKL